MSGECQTCAEHCLDCKCQPVYNCGPLCQCQENDSQVCAKEISYIYIASKDEHIVNLLNWIDMLETFKQEVSSTERDRELEDEIGQIISRLTMEIGIRLRMVFP